MTVRELIDQLQEHLESGAVHEDREVYFEETMAPTVTVARLEHTDGHAYLLDGGNKPDGGR